MEGIRLRWGWLVLVALTLAGFAWMTRYEHLRFSSGEEGFAEWRWDRWLHRACYTRWEPKKGQSYWQCP